MYLDAMQQAGASTDKIVAFVDLIKYKNDVGDAYSYVKLPVGVRAFLNFTFDTIRYNDIHLQGYVFTFGREDLIPDMFLKIVDGIDSNMLGTVTKFKYEAN